MHPITERGQPLYKGQSDWSDSTVYIGNAEVYDDLSFYTYTYMHLFSFVLRFIEQDGLEHVLGFLQSMNIDVRRSQLHFTIIGCVKALMNNTVRILAPACNLSASYSGTPKCRHFWNLERVS